ncbi:helix-turn-helix domain-containing protein [Streptomyces sp. DSM 41527]|uniref:Helix-turn-helix domain-containing protein n=1 Tax=Streptomyces mooreae TaxID=3075523 RepID=A0ABU2T4R1_9ACTN|nr:helix-turn-helix domain-containing protein [Streptomyces sp. DSM 41527]MDT0456212.1 helix-turn-helix domain-containing protein [Streptomyces sp. DSM 41527]
MAFQHFSAPSRASSAVPRPTARSGVVHVNNRHTTRYTVVGNHLAQHRELSLLAIGLAVHIQSLPVGALVGIKFLSSRFPESEHRIAGALRELEAHGYLKRTRERLPGGKVVTRTVSYNQPGSAVTAAPEPVHTPQQPRKPPPATQKPTPGPEEPAAPAPAPRPVPRQALPQPRTLDLERHRTATALLAELHRHEPGLLLSERDVHRLAPATAAWLERGASPDAVRRTLTARLPEPLKHPAALLAHRLTALLPAPLPTAVVRPALRPDPFQTCESCERAFRAPEPGYCRDCRTDRRGRLA